MRRLIAFHLSTIGAVLIGLSGPAFALDPHDLAEKLATSVNVNGYTLNYGDAALAGDDVILSDVVLTGPFANANTPNIQASLGEVRLQGVRDNGVNAYVIEMISVDTVTLNDGDQRYTFGTPTFRGISVPFDPSGNSISSMLLYEKMSAGPVTTEVSGSSLTTVQEMSATLVADGNRLAFSSDVVRFSVGPTLPGLFDTDLTRKGIQQLGLERIEGNVHMEGFWDPLNGMLSVTDMYLDLDSIGKLGGRFEIEGYTAALAKRLRGDENVGAVTSYEATLDFQLREAISALDFHNAAIYFQDWGITEAILEVAAKEQNVSRAQMDMTVAEMVSFVASFIEPKQLAEQFTDASQAFLMDGGAISIEANPASPVSFSEIYLVLFDSPIWLPVLLEMTMRAND